MPARTDPPPHIERVDYATLVAAVSVEHGSAAVARRREACKKILAQVYRVVAAVLGQHSPDVGDATQDAFMHVYNNIPSFKHDAGKGSPAAWVNVLALTKTIDRRRSIHRRSEKEIEFDDTQHGGVSEIDIHGGIERKQFVGALLSGLDTLDERHRAVLVLRHWNGQTDEEIAATLGIPVGTVKTRLATAKGRLAQHVRIYLGLSGHPVSAGKGLTA